MMFRSNSRLSNTARPTLFIPNSNNNVSNISCPASISTEPQRWNREDVKIWLSWCLEEFALEDVDLDRFSMNGKALCMLKKADFNDRAKNGDVLFNALQELLALHKVSPVPYSFHQNGPVFPGAPEALYDRISASPHDLLTESPLVASSPPACVFSRQKSANIYRSLSRQSTQMLSRSPSPCVDSPLDLSRDKDQDRCISGDESSGSTNSDRNSQVLNLSTPPIDKQMSEFQYPLPKTPSTLSPGARSPARRPSPSGDSSPVPMKMKRMHGSDSGQSSPGIYYPNNNYLTTPEVNREPSPERLQGLHQKMAMARLDSRDMATTPDEQRKFMTGSQNIYFAGETEIVQGGNTRERSSYTETEIEDRKEKVKPYHIYPIPDSDGRRNSQIPLTVNNIDQVEDCYDPDIQDGDTQGDTKLLWEFIYQLLKSPEYTSLVRWEDEERLVFRIVNPAELARLWGLQKSRGNMTYEKLSRALRYYYKMNIIVKEPQRRLTYRFVKPPESIQRGQKGAKPGVSHKKRGSLSPSASPRGSPPSVSPLSCSPSSPSPTQVPIHSPTPPMDKFTTPHYFTPNHHSNADTNPATLVTPPVTSPKTYSPITARAYYNLCRQYSIDKSRGSTAPWLMPTNNLPRIDSLSGESENAVVSNEQNRQLKKEDSEQSETDAAPLPFQHREESPVRDNHSPGRASPIKNIDKDDMIKQESLEFSITEGHDLPRGDSTDDGKDHKDVVSTNKL